MWKIKHFLCEFRDDESGASAIEYVIIGALIAVTVISGATVIGKESSGNLINVSNAKAWSSVK